jgi:hypothetical protein
MRAGFKGYNEIVVDSATWVRELPASVEAIFLVQCNHGDKQLAYGAGEGHTTARDCADAHARGIDMHQRFLQAYGKSASDFPLLLLRPHEWDEPFVKA